MSCYTTFTWKFLSYCSNEYWRTYILSYRLFTNQAERPETSKMLLYVRNTAYRGWYVFLASIERDGGALLVKQDHFEWHSHLDLNRLYTTGVLKSMLEGKNYPALDMLFLSVTVFKIRATCMPQNCPMTWASSMSSKFLLGLHKRPKRVESWTMYFEDLTSHKDSCKKLVCNVFDCHCESSRYTLEL